jgi:hypothetical protein
LVPTHTTQLQAGVSSADGTTPVTFDLVCSGPETRTSPRSLAAPGTIVSGTLYVDDLTLGLSFGNNIFDGDELAALPYKYTIG